jgi:hypothetical protein
MCLLASYGVGSANPLHQRLAGLPEAERNARLTAMLRTEECRVVWSFFQGLDQKGAAHWNVTCANRRTFAVRIKGDATGSSGVLECSLLEGLGGATCFTALPTTE